MVNKVNELIVTLNVNGLGDSTDRKRKYNDVTGMVVNCGMPVG